MGLEFDARRKRVVCLPSFATRAALMAGVAALVLGGCASSSGRWTAKDAAREKSAQLEWLRRNVVFKPSPTSSAPPSQTDSSIAPTTPEASTEPSTGEKP
jgi:hypothetical protein